jgi:hypothetical protein
VSYSQRFILSTQVRAACSWLGTPIVGDREYGGGEVAMHSTGVAGAGGTVTLLHSALLEFPSMDGRHKYAICHAPTAEWTGSRTLALPDCTALVQSLGDPTVGALRLVFEKSQRAASVAAATAAASAIASAGPPKINEARLRQTQAPAPSTASEHRSRKNL